MAAESIGISIASMVAELLVEPIVRQFRYMCCFNTLVGGLEEEEGKLEKEKNEMQRTVEENVEAWLKNTGKAIKDVQDLKQEIEKDKSCFSKWCPNFIRRYQLGRRVAKETTKLSNLIKEKGNLPKFSPPTAPTPIEFLPNKDFMSSSSTESALEKIMNALKDDNENMIGLYGMGGVGKTTLVKEVGKVATELKMFDKVLFAVVSKTVEITNIQAQIEDKLGFELKEKTKDGRASRLWQRLKSEKKLLVILDDVWEHLDLKEIGIPFGEDGMKCKILLTTRRQHVCNSMGCQRMVKLGVLSPNEAWALFKVKANLPEDSPLTEVAMEVAKECKGLPIAIVTVGRALRGKSSDAWDAAVKRLKRSELLKIEDVDADENAYKCLKLSFDHLSKWETQLCFLFCSLFPEDYEIDIEDLVRYAMGFGLYEDMDSIEEARKEVHVAVEKLIDSCLLLETESPWIGTESGHLKMHDVDKLIEETERPWIGTEISTKSRGDVKMHDVVRDVALWISKDWQWRSSDGNQTYKAISMAGQNKWPIDCTSISLLGNNISKVPQANEDLVYPKLKMLLLGRSDRDYRRRIHVSDVSFNGMKELTVLRLEWGLLSTKSLASLTNLQTLELKYCRINDPTSEGNDIDDFSSLQMLKSLKILSFQGSSFKELPRELGELNNLKLLDLRRCWLGRIPPNTIKRLSKLEELYTDEFRGWEVEQGTNASLMELCSLAYLTVLWLNVKHQIPEDFDFPSLTSYYVGVGYPHISYPQISYPHISYPQISYPTTRSVCCKASEFNITKMRKLFSDAYDLVLTDSDAIFKSIIPDMDSNGLKNLIRLDLERCQMKCLINTTQQQQPLDAFSNLEVISMSNTHVEEFCDGQPPEGFLKNLKTVNMELCSVRTVFPAKLWQALQNLEAVRIEGCDIKLVFQFDEANEVSKRLLSNLRWLHIREADAMEHIWKGPTHGVSLKSLTSLSLYYCSSLGFVFPFPLAQTLVHLQKLKINSCGNLKHIISEDNEEANEIVNSEAHSQSHGLQNLKTIEIWRCDSLEYVFPISFAQTLVHLQTISVFECGNLKHIISEDNEKANEIVNSEAHSQSHGLQNLKKVDIHGCNSLEYVFPISFAQTLVHLQHLSIKCCGNLKHIISEDNEEANEIVNSEAHSQIRHFFGNGQHSKEELNASVIFPSLQNLKIAECPQLSMHSVDKIKPPTKVLEISEEANCGIAESSQLKSVRINNCGTLEHIIAKENDGEESRRSLKSLVNSSFYNYLQRIEVFNCQGLKSLFLVTVLQELPQLEYLKVEKIDELVEVFEHEGLSDNERKKEIVVPRLLELHLKRLPRLIRLCSGYHFTFPSLERLILNDCPTLITHFSVTDAVTQALEISEEANCSRLVSIEISDYGTLEHIIAKENDGEESRSSLISPINSPFYNNLQSIKVFNCQGLKSLFLVTVLQVLPQLEYLKVEKIEELVEVFEHEGVLDTERREEIVVPKLLELHLERLPRLIRLCSGFYQFTFPSLKSLHVNDCPALITRFLITEPIHSVDVVAQEPETVGQQTLSGSIPTATSQNINWQKEEEEESYDYEEEQSSDD